jgi:predicted acetyltransferase
MYRVINVEEAIAQMSEVDCGPGTLKLRLQIKDSFMPENDGELGLSLHEGRMNLANPAGADASLSIDISDFSSLLMGAVPLRRLLSYGLATLSEPAYLDLVDRLFNVKEKPVCYTGF